MKASYPSTCAMCGLSINPGEDIERTRQRRYDFLDYAHTRCNDADWPAPKDMVDCPKCGEQMQARELWDHMAEACDGFRMGAMPWQIKSALRDIAYAELLQVLVNGDNLP